LSIPAPAQTPQSAEVLESTPVNQQPTALDRYVAAADDSFRWEKVRSYRQGNCTVHVLDLVSQTWRTEDDVSKTVWQHWLTVVVPDETPTDTAMLFITGGSTGPAPRKVSPEMVLVAGSSRVVVAELKMVPNQPLEFHGDGKPRYEDDIIGYTWDQYLKTGDETWPLQLPMTKAAVRAMDAVQQFLGEHDDGAAAVNDFVVAGASKRGWTTWLTAAVDDRVKAIAPIVIDVLNMNVSMQHHWDAYGFWAPAIQDYVHHQIPERRNLPEYRQLLQIVDPYAYRDRLTMPKCIINATGDQFFLPDSSQFYFDALPGEKQLCYVPNAGHSLEGSNAIDTLASFLMTVAYDKPRPQVRWKFPEPQVIEVVCDAQPEEVRLWVCRNPETRDFRVDTVGKSYRPRPLEPVESGVYRVRLPVPDEGWAAAFVECTFDVGAVTSMRCTTPVCVLPDELPYEDQLAPGEPQP
jgi:PhoPQ-activated pathogenicity-related protein